MYCGTNIMPAVIHPTKCCVNHTFSTTVVPHIHPSHTTTVNHHLFEHKHYFPQTQSLANEVSNQQFNCGPGPVSPAPVPPVGPGFGPGMGGPGFGPGMGGPGFGPGMGGPGFGPGMGAPGFGPGPYWGR